MLCILDPLNKRYFKYFLKVSQLLMHIFEHVRSALQNMNHGHGKGDILVN